MPRRLQDRHTVRIRDPIHGTIHLSPEEVLLIDSAAYQRLRMIKQLGLADLAFPGATHTRYAHGIGTMHIASRMVSSLLVHYELDRTDAHRLRETVRLSALFHDLGHAPLSHTTEAFMPKVSALGLGHWQEGPDDRRASHEDYTLKLLLDSELTERIRRTITPEFGVTAEDLATLVRGRAPTRELHDRFVIGGVNFMPIMRQCVSSELDADRMDYLLRDSYYAGVPYGRYDHEWILENVRPVELSESVYLGLDARASFGFEDFLLSRYHMFTSVYFHQIPIGYEVMLKKYFSDQVREFEITADIEAYLACDDIYLWTALRRSKSPWARRVVERRAYRMLIEIKAFEGEHTEEAHLDLEELAAALKNAGIDAIVHSARGELSKYFKLESRSADAEELNPPLYMIDGKRSIPIEHYTPLYQRYAGAVQLRRVYVDPERLDDARKVLEKTRAI